MDRISDPNNPVSNAFRLAIYLFIAFLAGKYNFGVAVVLLLAVAYWHHFDIINEKLKQSVAAKKAISA